MTAQNYDTVEVLRDGSSVRIRAIRADDKPRLLRHFAHLSLQSVYFRFFGAKKRLTEDELREFTEPDFARHVGLVVTLTTSGEEEILGVGRFLVTSTANPKRAEVAFAVTDENQGRGIGTLLLDHLTPLARDLGIEEFEAEVLGDNNRMLEMFSRSGFSVGRSIDGGVVHVRFPTRETPQHTERSGERERESHARSLQPFFRPRSVAVIGASARPRTIGHSLLANLVGSDFRGEIYPVNLNTDRIDGRSVWPSVSAIGATVDLAVVAVPAAAVESVLEDCAKAGVRAVVVISAGFAEVAGEAGREAEARIVRFLRGAGVRMVGPNCMGLLNTDPTVSLNATFAPAWPPAGSIGMLSQSGALGLAVLDHARERHLGISTFVSVGNKADVSGNDLLCFWEQDPRTQVIVLYLESFGNPRKFARIAPAVARRKPIVAVKSGRSAAGSRAASSHSAALASRDIAVDALFRQAGVIRTDTLEELFDVAALLATQPLPAGRRVGVVTNAGGPGILLADACAAHGLELPDLGAETIATLRTFLPPQAGLANPVDMIASAAPQDFERTLAAVGRDPAIDAVVGICVPLFPERRAEVGAAMARGAALVPPEKPVLSVFLSSQGAPSSLDEGPRGAIPSFHFPENAARALGRVVRYGEWRRRPEGESLTLEPFALETIRAVLRRCRETRPADPWLGTEDVQTILRVAGIEMTPGRVVPVGEAASEASRLGFPLVAKAVAPGLLHKSDVGAVLLDLHGPEEVAAAAQLIARRVEDLGLPLDGILLQRQVPEGIEALVGVTTDPNFGPLVVCGFGGVLVELLHDVSFRLPPVSDVDAGEMLDRLQTSRLLDGYRGRPAGDRQALIDVIRRVSALVEAIPELEELDLNPVKVLPPGRGAVVVDGRMRLGPVTARSS